MSLTQAPGNGLRSNAPELEGLDHFNRLLRAFDRNSINASGGTFQFVTEEEGNFLRHELEIRSITPPAWAKSAIWRHNGHIAKVYLDGRPSRRKTVRRILTEATA